MASKAPSSSDPRHPDLGFPLEQPERGDDDAFDKETVPKMSSSSAMTEIGTVITGIHATSNQKLVGSMRSYAVEAHATAETTTGNCSNPRRPLYAPPASHEPDRRWIRRESYPWYTITNNCQRSTPMLSTGHGGNDRNRIT